MFRHWSVWGSHLTKCASNGLAGLLVAVDQLLPPWVHIQLSTICLQKEYGLWLGDFRYTIIYVRMAEMDRKHLSIWLLYIAVQVFSNMCIMETAKVAYWHQVEFWNASQGEQHQDGARNACMHSGTTLKQLRVKILGRSTSSDQK
jgi:hypothetical protein